MTRPLIAFGVVVLSVNLLAAGFIAYFELDRALRNRARRRRDRRRAGYLDRVTR